MAKGNVVWTRTAELQFVGILEFWVERNKSSLYSRKLVEMVSRRAKQIAEKPFLKNLPTLKTRGSLHYTTLEGS